jgi:hypothetical protein
VAGDAEQAYQKSIGAIFGKIGELKEKRKGKSEFVLNIPEETAPEETDDSSSTWNAF